MMGGWDSKGRTELLPPSRFPGNDKTGNEKVLLTAQPDLRIVKFSFAARRSCWPGIIAYLLPLAIDDDFKVAGSFLLAGIGMVGIICLLAVYEGLSKAVYRLTSNHIEEESGIFFKQLRRIPLSYVRDVTLDQNFVQAAFRVSSITVTPTSGDKIVLANVRDGKLVQETIWQMVLSKSPKLSQHDQR